MDISKEQYKIVFTNYCIKEMDYIYNYISKALHTLNSAKKLMQKIEDIIQNLKYMPRMYNEVNRYSRFNMRYRKILVNNYIILYTILEKVII